MTERLFWIGGALLALAGLVFYGFGLNSPNPARWAALSGIVSIAGIAWAWRGGSVRLCALQWTALSFLGYAYLSLLWSPDWREGVLSLYCLTIAAGLFFVVLHAERKMLARVVPIVASAAALVSVAGHIWWPVTYGLTGNENFQAELLILFIPLCLIALSSWPDTWTGGFCLVATFSAASMLFLVNPSDAKWAGLGGLGALVVLVCVRRRYFGAAFVLVACGCAALWALLSRSVLVSIGQRLELGYNTILMWADRPILGTGIGGFGYFYPDYHEAHVGLIDSRSLYGVWLYAGAAHNEFIQTLAVFGLAGATFVGIFAWRAFRQMHNDPLASWSLATLSVLAGLCVVNFPLQNPATAAIAACTLAMAVKPGEAVALFEIVHRALSVFRVFGYRRSVNPV